LPSDLIVSLGVADAVGDARASVQAATPSDSAPVTDASALGTAAQLSEKMTMLSMKLMQVVQPSEQAYQNYFSEIGRFLLIILQQLDADSARARAGIQALPSFCKELMTNLVRGRP
jgi:hypothetical protein